MHQRVLAALIAAAACAVAAPASGGEPVTREDRTAEAPRFPASVDELSAPRLPPPFVLPELSHSGWDLGVAWLVGLAAPARDDRRTSALGIARASAEGDLGFPRRLYIGGAVPFASALAPDGTSGSKTVLGNVELHARVVFPLPSWLAFGAVFGLVLPTARYDRGTAAHEAAMTAASLEPTDAVQFRPDAVAFRPGMDVRVLRGPFVVQVRQGIDVVLDTSGRAVTFGRFLGHGGIRVRKDVELSIEGTQLYAFDERVRDDRRSALTLGPGARLLLGGVDVGAAVVTNVFAPLSPALDHFVAARISLVAHLE